MNTAEKIKDYIAVANAEMAPLTQGGTVEEWYEEERVRMRDWTLEETLAHYIEVFNVHPAADEMDTFVVCTIFNRAFGWEE